MKAMDAAECLEPAVRDPPAYGAWNVQIVAAGTGEALPGPAICGVVAGATRPITGSRREVGGVPGGRRRRPWYWLSRADNITAGEGRAATSFDVHR